MGRPSKLTPETQAAIVKAVRAGNYPEIAAQSVGVASSTYFGWMERGRAGESPFAEFSEAITQARALAERKMVRIVRTAALDDPRAAEWYLERSASDRWGRRDKLTIESAVNAELDAMLGKLEARLPPDVYALVLAALTDRDPGAEAAGDSADGRGTTH